MIYIPVASDEQVKEEVLNSLPESPTIVSSPRIEDHYASIAANRRKIFELFLKTDEKYLKMQDRHILHLAPDSFKQAEEFLDEHEDWGAVALFVGKRLPRPDKNHVKFDCVVIRREALVDIKLELNGGCDCIAFCREIRKKYRYGYLNKLYLVTNANIKQRSQ